METPAPRGFTPVGMWSAGLSRGTSTARGAQRAPLVRLLPWRRLRLPAPSPAPGLWFYSPISCRLPVWLVGLGAMPGSGRGLGIAGACMGTPAPLPVPHHPQGRACPGVAGSSRAAFRRRAARGHGMGAGTAGLTKQHQPWLPLGPSLAGQEAAAHPQPPRVVTPLAWPRGAGKSCPEPLARLTMRGRGVHGGRGSPSLLGRGLSRCWLSIASRCWCPRLGEGPAGHRWVLPPSASPRAPGEQLGAGQERHGGEALESSPQPGRP